LILLAPKRHSQQNFWVYFRVLNDPDSDKYSKPSYGLFRETNSCHRLSSHIHTFTLNTMKLGAAAIKRACKKGSQYLIPLSKPAIMGGTSGQCYFHKTMLKNTVSEDRFGAWRQSSLHIAKRRQAWQKEVFRDMTNKELSILHVEDDPGLAWIVRTVFEDLGFSGTTIISKSVRAALNLLNERERKQQRLGLIISDIRLPDGSGLDLIREVKTNPYWRMTPVIVLSGDKDPAVINAAYALGANSYLPKDPPGTNLVVSLESFYKCWLENVQLPQNAVRDRVQEALDRATGLRARTAEFFLNLARGSGRESETKFWLDRALVEGNLSNLLAFFRDKLNEQDFPPGAIDRVVTSQVQVANALITAEEHLKKTPSPDSELLYQWVLELMDALDEEVFVEALVCLFPKGPVVATALKARVAAQFKALAVHILDHTQQTELRQKAVSLKELTCLRSNHMMEEKGLLLLIIIRTSLSIVTSVHVVFFF
jgi:CheY-like chemotaxis protein